jgi:cell division cycle 2-like protein
MTPPVSNNNHQPIEKELIDEKPPLPHYYPAIQGCRRVDEYSCLNRIEEGTYGVVFRARDKKTGLDFKILFYFRIIFFFY